MTHCLLDVNPADLSASGHHRHPGRLSSTPELAPGALGSYRQRCLDRAGASRDPHLQGTIAPTHRMPGRRRLAASPLQPRFQKADC